jgi:hypothetical protein
VRLVVDVFQMEIIAQNVQKEDAVVQHQDRIYNVSLIVTKPFFDKILFEFNHYKKQLF